MNAMGGANIGRSNKEEANPPEEMDLHNYIKKRFQLH
jgi:hypothetical protein